MIVMADNQDPLAALQQLLEDQKAQADSASKSADPNAQASASEAPVAEEEKAPALTAEEIAVLQKNKQEEDQVKIEEQLNKMQTELKDTPEYQARVSQKKVSDADAEQKRLEERSKQIFQLKHLDP